MKRTAIVGGKIEETPGSAAAAASVVRYTRTAIALHWAMAALILFTLPLGVYGANAAGDLARTAKDIHKPIGILILALTLLRIGWRLGHTPPELPATMTPALRRVARGTHIAVYVLMLVLPISGWWLSSAVPTRHPISFVLFDVPFLPIPRNFPSIGVSHTAHVVLGFAMIGLAALHIAAALKHHFVNADDVLRRMLPLAR